MGWKCGSKVSRGVKRVPYPRRRPTFDMPKVSNHRVLQESRRAIASHNEIS